MQVMGGVHVIHACCPPLRRSARVGGREGQWSGEVDLRVCVCTMQAAPPRPRPSQPTWRMGSQLRLAVGAGDEPHAPIRHGGVVHS